MGPAIALRLRQHLTLTPQVQQALRLLQMSAMEFAQEMEQAVATNPFLEENPDAPAPSQREASVEEVVLPHEGSGSSAPAEREQDEWGGVSDTQPTLQEHLREQLRMSRVSDRDRALAEMVVDSLDEDGYFKATFEELAALLPKEHEVMPEEFAAALKLVQSLDPPGVAARTL
ncbi:MAG TPA: RNA polymerase factor sigma-54, partial [Burkholderiales bacterium]|nr:RNA polymerase factor sigma-54 [Burkholderiales bacterium]